MKYTKFTTYQIAKNLKNLGFDGPALGVINQNSEIVYTDAKSEYYESQEKAQCMFGNPSIQVVLAPLWQDAVDFLRDKYGIIVRSVPLYQSRFIGDWNLVGYYPHVDGDDYDIIYPEYYDALKIAVEHGSLKALESSDNK